MSSWYRPPLPCTCLQPAGRDRRGRWFHYDDEYVAPLAGRPALGGAEGDGYLLLYANTALDGPWSDDDAGHGS